MKHIVYADNAATTRLDNDALDAMMPFLKHNLGNASQPYSLGKCARKAIERSRDIIAECIGASPEEIYFTSGGTEGNNWIIRHIAPLGLSSNKQCFVTTSFEHHSVLRPFQEVSNDISVKFISPDSNGIVTAQSLFAELADAPSFVSVMTANNEIGTIQDIRAICDSAHQLGAAFHTDAVQAIGHIHVDVRVLNVDYLTASAHKFNGPKGIGFVFASKRAYMVPQLMGGDQERGQRAGTENTAAIVGMAVALYNNCLKMEANRAHKEYLAATLLRELRKNDIEFILNGSENRLPGHLSLTFPGADGEGLLHGLDLMSICVASGAACTSSHIAPSHVLTAIGLSSDMARGTIRVTLGKDNTEAEVVRIASALARLLHMRR